MSRKINVETLKDVIKGGGRKVKKGLTGDYDLAGMSKNQSKYFKTMVGVTTASALFIGATSVVDAVSENEKNRQRKRANEQQLKEQAEEEKRKYKKRHTAPLGGVNLTTANHPTFRMFDQRSGHHKMGNSRF